MPIYQSTAYLNPEQFNALLRILEDSIELKFVNLGGLSSRDRSLLLHEIERDCTVVNDLDDMPAIGGKPREFREQEASTEGKGGEAEGPFNTTEPGGEES
jgi:hypothetical protein